MAVVLIEKGPNLDQNARRPATLPDAPRSSNCASPHPSADTGDDNLNTRNLSARLFQKFAVQRKQFRLLVSDLAKSGNPMKRPLRLFLRVLATLSAVCCLTLVVLRFRSSSRTDVLMVPTGSHSVMLLKSHTGFTEAGWFEITFASNWEGPRLGFWSGPGWQNVGPFLIQWRVRYHSLGDVLKVLDQTGSKLQLVVGSYMTPKDSPSGPISYENSYHRAVQLGYFAAMAPPPQSAVVSVWHLQVLHTMLIVLFLPLPLALCLASLLRWLRQPKTGCPVCGYDLRATPERCPECGTKVTPKPTTTT